MTSRPKRSATLGELIADVNAQRAERSNLLVELGLVNPDTGELVSNAEIDRLVARARRHVEDRRNGGAE